MNGRHVSGPAVAVLAAALAACGGGGGGGSSGFASPGTSTPPPVARNASMGGIWEGTIRESTGEVYETLGLVTESGEFHFLTELGTQAFGTATTSDSNVSASYVLAPEIGYLFADGSPGASGTLTGTVQERTSLSGTLATRTSRGTSYSGTLSMRYNAIYERDSSPATIAGNFREPGGTVVNVSANGVIFAQDALSGCVINGTVGIIDANYNAYRVQYAYSSCRGADAVLNGATFRGLATLDGTSRPEELIVGVTGSAGGTTWSIIWVLQRV